MMTRERFPLLATLDDSALSDFQQQATRLQIGKDEQLLAQDSYNDRLYLVASGKMVVRKRHGGRDLLIGFVGGGDICGEGSLLGAGCTSAAIYSIGGGELYAIPGALIVQQYRDNVHFRRAIDRVIERRQVNSALALNALFSVLPVDVRQSMYHVGEMVHFACGEVLVREHDDDISRMYLLLDGEAEGSIEVPDGSGRLLKVSHYGMGDQVGEIALLTHPVRIATVTVTAAITALCISNKTLHTFRMGSLDFALALYENSRLRMMRHLDLLLPEVGEAKAREATLDRMVPLELYRNPEKQMAQPYA